MSRLVRSVTLDGRPVHAIEVSGHGAPIVLLHGGVDSISTLRDLPEALAAATGRPVVAYDRLGHGRSAGPPDGTGWPDAHRQVEADRLVALLDALGVERAVLVGHSDGGAIALLAAGRHGDRVSGVVALTPQLVNNDVVQEGIAAAVGAFRNGRLRAALKGHHDDVDHVFEGWSGVWLRSVFGAESVVGDLRAVRCPVAMVVGLDDPYGYRANAQLLVGELAVPFELVVLAGAGHLPHHARRPETVAVVERLVAAIVD